MLEQVVADGKLKIQNGELRRRIVRHLNEYYTLGFNRRPEHMCIQWTTNLPQTVKSDLLKRVHREIYASAIDFPLAFYIRIYYNICYAKQKL